MSDEQAAAFLEHPAAVANDYFHWELEFPEVFFDEYGRPKGDAAGFDAVVANPPYQVMENMSSQERSYYYSDKGTPATPMFFTAMHKVNLYALFTERGLQLNSKNGYWGYIMPYSWLSNSSFIRLRQELVDNNQLSTLTLLPVGVFDAGIATGITLAQRKSPDSEAVIKVSDLREYALDDLPISLHGAAYKAIPIQSIKASDAYVFNIEWDHDVDSLLRRINNSSNPLSFHCNIDRGCDTANNAQYIGYSDDKALNPKPLLKGEFFDRYEYYWDGSFLYYLPEQMIKERPTARPGSAERFEVSEKLIVYRFLNKDNLIAGVYDNEQFYSLGSTYIVSARVDNTLNMLYLLAIINSRLIAYYNARRFSGVKITLTELTQLPIHTIRFHTPVEERKRSVGSLMSIINDSSIDANEVVSRQIPADRSDIVHDLLVYLAEQMIAMHKEKQALTTDFWTDLEGVTDPAAFDKLRNKGKQEDGLAKDPALAPFVNPDSKSARTLDESLAWDEAAFKAFVRELAGRVDGLSRLVKVWHDYAPRYRELTERITRTDWLIDQIVYKLYGLTDEEIAIVEGKN